MKKAGETVKTVGACSVCGGPLYDWGDEPNDDYRTCLVAEDAFTIPTASHKKCLPADLQDELRD